MKYVMVAQTRPKEGREQEFNDWYDNVHLSQVLAVPGFTAAQRFQVASGKSPYPMIALYEVEADEPQEIWKLTEQLAAGMIHTEALDEAAAFIIQPIGPRVEAVSE